MINKFFQNRFIISAILTVSIMAWIIGILNMPIRWVALAEILTLLLCIVFFHKVDVTQWDIIQYKPKLLFQICEWIWAAWFVFHDSRLYYKLQIAYPSLKNLISENVRLNCIIEPFPRFLQDNICYMPIVICMLPCYLIIIRFLFLGFGNLIKSMSGFEKRFVLISTAVFTAALIIISSKTSYFVYPVDSINYKCEDADGIQYHRSWDICNHFFDTDTGRLLAIKFYNSDNHSRHPYFSYVMIGFFPVWSVLCLIYHLFFNSVAYSYALSISTIQILLYVLSGIFIGRIIQKTFNANDVCIFPLTYICTFPFVFVFVPERLIFSSFFLIFAVYLAIAQSESKNNIIVSLLALGTTFLSIIPISVIYFLNKQWKNFLILFTVSVMVLAYYPWENNNVSINGANRVDRIANYCQMLESCFCVPEWNVHEDESLHKTMIQTSLERSYYSTLITGSLIFLLCLIGFGLFWKERFAQSSLIWLITSLGIVGIVGFGNEECVLFNTYFSWAIISLSLLPFYLLGKKFPKLPVSLLIYILDVFWALNSLYFVHQIVEIVSNRYCIPPGF